jgi:hypothetical protein
MTSRIAVLVIATLTASPALFAQQVHARGQAPADLAQLARRGARPVSKAIFLPRP